MTMKKDDLKIVFFGTPDFAVESLDAINNAGYDVAAVVTMPDKEAGRGHKLFRSPVKMWALEHGKTVLQPVSLKDESFIDELRSIGANLFIVIAFRMLPEKVWGMPELGTFNLHASLLPRYRGAAPINWAIINGDKDTGVTTFFLKHEIDTGDVICQESLSIHEGETVGELHDRLMQLGAEVTLKTLEKIVEGTAEPLPQDQMGFEPTPAPKIFHENCFIDFDRQAADIYNFVRGLSPYPAARALLQFPSTAPAEYKIFEVAPEAIFSTLQSGKPDIADGKLLVGCANGAVEILSLQAPGKKRLSARDFLNGIRK